MYKNLKVSPGFLQGFFLAQIPIRVMSNFARLITEEAFRPLKDEAFFENVRVDAAGYGISWNDYVDLSELELWVNGRDRSQ